MAKKKKESKKETEEITIEEKFSDLNDKHLRLFAEFENFKKRTAKERMNFTKQLEKVFLVPYSQSLMTLSVQ